MTDDTDKILHTLERLEAGQQTLRGDIKALRTDVIGLQEGQKSLREGVQDLRDGQKSLQETGERRGKLLTGVSQTVGTILEEQQAQRMDIRSLHDQGRSLHDELHATKEELRSEILTSRAEAKRDTMDLKASVVRTLKGHEQRIDELEDAASIPHPDEN